MLLCTKTLYSCSVQCSFSVWHAATLSFNLRQALLAEEHNANCMIANCTIYERSQNVGLLHTWVREDLW